MVHGKFIQSSVGKLEHQWIETPNSDTTLVLLHEGLGCIAMWKGFAERLAEQCNCNVFAYSRLGYGHSDSCILPRSFHYMHQEAALLDELITNLPEGRIFLVGHSDGGSIAALYAANHHTRITAGIILIAPHFFVEEQSLIAIVEARKAYLKGHLRERLAKYHGEDDEYGSAAQLTALTQHCKAPVESHFITHCGHAPHLSHPEFIASKIAHFIQT